MEEVWLGGHYFDEFAEKLILMWLDLTKGVHFIFEADLIGLVYILKKFLNFAVAHFFDGFTSTKLI